MGRESPPPTSDVGPITAEALAAVIEALANLSDDARKRVLHAASAFYRVERQ